MRVTLIHNPTAGAEQPSADALVGWLGAAGYDVRYASSKKRAYVDALADPGDLVVAAGGDGTVTKIATRLVGRDVPLAILPLGTSNNIAFTLGVSGPAEKIVRALPTAERRRLDIGVARAAWGESRFVESAGVGLFGAMLQHAESGSGPGNDNDAGEDRIALSVRGTRRALDRQPARAYRIEADGVDLSGRYVLVAAMNVKRIGSTLELAPGADPADGMLDLVMLRDEDRPVIESFLERRLDDPAARFPIHPRRVRVVRIGWDATFGHLDDERWPEQRIESEGRGGEQVVEITIADPPIEVLV
jgi:diacylglycerol kinase family enzyme